MGADDSGCCTYDYCGPDKVCDKGDCHSCISPEGVNVSSLYSDANHTIYARKIGPNYSSLRLSTGKWKECEPPCEERQRTGERSTGNI